MARKSELAFSVAIALVLVFGVVTALDLPGDSRFFPLAIGVPAIALASLQVFLDATRQRAASDPEAVPQRRIVDIGVDGGSSPQRSRRIARAFSWVGGYLALTWMVGFYVTSPLFLMAYLLVEARIGWLRAALITLGVAAVMFGVLQGVLGLPLPRGALLPLAPGP